MIRKQVFSKILLLSFAMLFTSTTTKATTDETISTDTEYLLNQLEETTDSYTLESSEENKDNDIYFNDSDDLFDFDLDEEAFSEHLRTIEQQPTNIPLKTQVKLLVSYLDSCKEETIETICNNPKLSALIGTGIICTAGGLLYYTLATKKKK